MPLSPKRPSLVSQGPATRDFSDAELCSLFAYNFGSMYTYIAESSEIVYMRENDAGWRWCVTDNKWSFYNVVLNKNTDLLSRNTDSFDQVIDEFRKHNVPCRVSIPTVLPAHLKEKADTLEKHLKSRGFIAMIPGKSDMFDQVIDEFRKHNVPCRVSIPTVPPAHLEEKAEALEKHLKSRGFIAMIPGEDNIFDFDLHELSKEREAMRRVLDAEKLTSFADLEELDMSHPCGSGKKGFAQVFARAFGSSKLTSFVELEELDMSHPCGSGKEGFAQVFARAFGSSMMVDNSEWFISAFRTVKFGKKSAASGSSTSTSEGDTDGGGGDAYYPLRIFGAIEKETKKLMACVFLYVDGDTAGIYSLSTLQHGRGRGIGTALMYQAMIAAKAAGYRHMLLMSSPNARPLYRRMNFRAIGRSREMICFKHCGKPWAVVSAYLETFGLNVWPLVAIGGAVIASSAAALWSASGYFW